MAAERLQKIIAQVGIASRRKAEELIQQGLVTVNGKVAVLGEKAELGVDSIKVEGKLIQAPSGPVYIALNKPKAVISALADPEGRQTVTAFLEKMNTRVYPVGNLEYNAEGLLILTNDGDFANEIQNREDIPWIYHVKVKGHPDAEMIQRIEAGATINHRMVKPRSVRVAEKLEKKAKVEVVLLGPGGSELKALFEMRGFLVERVVRTAIGQITLHGLEPGRYRHLKKSQVEAILKQPELGLKRIDREAARAAEKEEARAKAEERREKLGGRRGASRGPKPLAIPKPLGAGGTGKIVRPRAAAAKPSRGPMPRGRSSRDSSYGTEMPRTRKPAFGGGGRKSAGPGRPSRDSDRKPRGAYGDKPRGAYGDKPRGTFGGKSRGPGGAGPRAASSGKPRGPGSGPRSASGGKPRGFGRPGAPKGPRKSGTGIRVRPKR